MAFLSSLSYSTNTVLKKALLFGLSKYGVLDLDTSKLEKQLNVEFSMRKPTIVELRGVGIHVETFLSKLKLQLPDDLEVTKAQILLLRLTIPPDFYRSSIAVDIEAPHDPGGYLSSDDDIDAALTAQDLAKSFLQHEPVETKIQLEAVINAQPELLQESMSSSGYTEDGEVLGTGAGLSLPGFLTNFFQGVIDRFQVTVKDLEITLGAELPISDELAAPSQETTTSVSVTLRVADVDIEGVTSTSHEDSKYSTKRANRTEGPSTQRPSRSGMRRVLLRRIRTELISDGAVFASASRSETVASTASSLKHSAQDKRALPYMQRSIVTFGGDRLADAREEGEEGERYEDRMETSSNKNLARSRVRAREFDSDDHEDLKHSFGDGLWNFAGGDDALSASFASGIHPADHNVGPTPGASVPEDSIQAAGLVVRPHRLSATFPSLSRGFDELLFANTPRHPRISQSQPSPLHDFPQKESADKDNKAQALVVPVTAELRTQSGSDGGTRQKSLSAVEDLSVSRVYSHADAESMYMSAMSEASDQGTKYFSIPGGWDAASVSTGDSESPSSHQLSQENMAGSVAFDGETNVADEQPTSRRSSNAGAARESVLPPLPSKHGEIPSEERRTESIIRSSLGLSSTSQESFHHASVEIKQLLGIDEVLIWVPNATKTQVERDTASPDIVGSVYSRAGASTTTASFRRNMPGAFSQYVEESIGRSQLGPVALEDSAFSSASSKPAPKGHTQGLEVEIGTIDGQLDAPAGRLIYDMIQKFLSAFNKCNPSTLGETAPPESAFTVSALHRLKLRQMSLAFVEHSKGVTRSSLDSSDRDGPEGNIDQILVQVNVQGLQMSYASGTPMPDLKIQLNKFTLGYADQDILSFDEGAKMRSSVRDLRGSRAKDISISVAQLTTAQGKPVTDFSITTLPMVFHLDLEKFDDVFSSFGGFSGIMELSSSIISNSTVVEDAPKARVRFAEADYRPPDRTPEMKINLRLGGTLTTLKGRSCGVTLQTSAIKVAYRKDYVALSIDAVKLSGPHHDPEDKDASVGIDLSSTRIEYLASPKDEDLERLLGLLTPSNDPYETNDDILVNTLLRQRRKGAVLRVTIGKASLSVTDLDSIKSFQALRDEMKNLSTVTRYLPEDDRPGILTLARIESYEARISINEKISALSLAGQCVRLAHVGLPSLLALEVGKFTAEQEGEEKLVREVLEMPPSEHLPMLMARMIGDEIEPIVKIKLYNACLEYRVPTLMAILGSAEEATLEDVVLDLTASVMTITELPPTTLARQSSGSSGDSKVSTKPLHIDVLLRDCALGLNPRDLPSKGLFVLANTRFTTILSTSQELDATLDVRRAFILVTNDAQALSNTTRTMSTSRTQSPGSGSRQVANLCERGYVSVSSVMSAKLIVKSHANEAVKTKSVDVEVSDELFVLETCADSTQTLVSILNGLKPPTPLSKEIQYRTEASNIRDMMASVTGDTFPPSAVKPTISHMVVGEHGDEPVYEVESSASIDVEDSLDDGLGALADSSMDLTTHTVVGTSAEDFVDDDDALLVSMSMLDPYQMLSPPANRQNDSQMILQAFRRAYQPDIGASSIHPRGPHHGEDLHVLGTAQRWKTNPVSSDLLSSVPGDCPFRIRMRNVHIIWNLYDGYDWQETRDTIAEAVKAVKTKAEDRKSKRNRSHSDEEEEESVIGDFLFNSIYIGIPANRDPRDLPRQINRNIDDLASETDTYAASDVSRPTSRSQRPAVRGGRLKLARSKAHKIAFELKGVSADVAVLPPGSGEVQSSVDVRVRDFEIFDNVPTSTWRKFATYMHDAGVREMSKPMIHIAMSNVKPVVELGASEIVMKVTVLPLRLHIDQDALDFMTRFFEFKDESGHASSADADQPFIQRLEVETVRLCFDYKPKKVDYAGLRSGHTNEFMNFITLDSCNIFLRHCIVYGIRGFDKLHKTLSEIWSPDVKLNQLPGILAGLGPVRGLVNVSAGVKDLVAIPILEYRKDGRLLRSVGKGARAFAKTTTSELARLGAKLAVGTQNVLQGAEDFLGPGPSSDSPRPSRMSPNQDWEDVDFDTSEVQQRLISKYADQPAGLLQGFRGAARALEHDLMAAKDAIIAIPGEVLESGSAAGAMGAVARYAPTIILRPAMGVSKAVSQTLMGVGNQVDRENRRRIEDKYKKH
ncbi:hypothetical protein B0A49_03977 [Cryomyces minteri]|uniref:Autophagy-related protein 2 n=3 Tax=Cryomyces TaxID=329878 RepID=A0A4U0XDX1_9PEZI|nr:hypothetical protein B0A49_03977 [Cryomyces minteri]